MPLALTPRLLRRGLELFAVISLIGVLLVLVFFGENLRSEEHTSELQSQSNLVCRLLLEKKKKQRIATLLSTCPPTWTRGPIKMAGETSTCRWTGCLPARCALATGAQVSPFRRCVSIKV